MQYQNAIERSISSGPTRAKVSGTNIHSLRVIGCNDETNASVVNKESTRRNDDDDRYTIEGNGVGDVSVPRK